VWHGWEKKNEWRKKKAKGRIKRKGRKGIRWLVVPTVSCYYVVALACPPLLVIVPPPGLYSLPVPASLDSQELPPRTGLLRQIPSRKGRDRRRPPCKPVVGAPLGQGGEIAAAPMGVTRMGVAGRRTAIDHICVDLVRFLLSPSMDGVEKAPWRSGIVSG
jgi:hypothetical protein